MRAPSLTPDRGASSAFIPDPESASENRAQSELERLREGLGGLVLGTAGCWLGMTRARLRHQAGGEPGIRVGTQCAAGSKGSGAGENSEHALFPEKQAGACAAQSASEAARPESVVAREPNDGAQRDPGLSNSRLEPVGSRSYLCARPFTHPREQPQPR